MAAPKVTLEQIEARIVLECYTTGDCFSVERMPELTRERRQKLLDDLGLLTVCVLVLDNGFTVTGESACVNPENFNINLGRAMAREKAVQKIWALEGYLLKERLHRDSINASSGGGDLGDS